MKNKILATVGLIAALVVGSALPAQAATAYGFGNGGPGQSMTIKQSSGTISVLPVGNRATYVTHVWVPVGKCVTLYSGATYKRCGVVNATWWAIPANGNWMGKQTNT